MNFVRNILTNLIKHVEKVIKKFEKKDINYGGCGMIATQVARYLNTFGFSDIKIRGYYIDKANHGSFEHAEHYSCVVFLEGEEFLINPPKFEPEGYIQKPFDVVENDIYFLNGSGAYKHKSDVDFHNELYKSSK